MLENIAILDAENEDDIYYDDRIMPVRGNSPFEVRIGGCINEYARDGRGGAYYNGLGFAIDAPDPCGIDYHLDKVDDWAAPNSATEFVFIFFEQCCKPNTASGLAQLITDNV
ncbi:hypothetical protein ACFL1S_08950 [Pseudomonadota bacterium]